MNRLNVKNPSGVTTPFYYYDLELLSRTLGAAAAEAQKRGYVLHYATKANANPTLLKMIFNAGFGADCVSGNEIRRSIECGANPKLITFAGVGKTDAEINLAIDSDIFCFNCESVPELENINALARAKGKIASVAIRINPDIDASTHAHISTGKKENKFGIAAADLDSAMETVKSSKNLKFVALHFHIGSQISDMNVFANLCARIGDFNRIFIERGLPPQHLNAGGGLGVDYSDPDKNPVPDFAAYFRVFEQNLKLRTDQTLHFEPGRSIVAQCGSLISTVQYLKRSGSREFVVLDAGMSDLIRPALYQAHHRIENLSSDKPSAIYDVVGPICESADCFAKDIALPQTRRGDTIALRSAGAYGEVMASRYNLRDLPNTVFSE
ncbi:MAG: diaminopimelate decarboxylase [Prevotellaceae bacterium]|jgi:diaminopimelate decarboxylase|nr:diaminopimelate decarboxylase [Prevotellaceae bacterium]